MIRIIVDLMDTISHGATGQVHFAADNGLDAGSFCRLIKVDTAVHDTVVGNGNGGLAKLLDTVHHALNAASTVQKAVFRMNMQMNKTHLTASFKISTSFFSR